MNSFLLKITGGTVAGLRVTSDCIEPGSRTITAIGCFVNTTAELLVKAMAFAGVEQECEISFDAGTKHKAPVRVLTLTWLNPEQYRITLQIKNEPVRLFKEITSCDNGGPTPPLHYPAQGMWMVGVYTLPETTILSEFFTSEAEARLVFDSLPLPQE